MPTGNRGQTSAPVDIFNTRDGWILVQIIGQPLYRRWVALMGEDPNGSPTRASRTTSRAATTAR